MNSDCKLSSWFKEIYNKKVALTIILLVLTISVIGLMIFAGLTTLDIFVANSSDRNIDHINAAALVMFTFLLVCIAWIQLTGIHKTAQSDFITRIMEHFNSIPLMKAQALIHQFCLQVEADRSVQKEKVIKVVSEKIRALRDDINNVDDFIHLKAFLDFLEGIAYLCNYGHVLEKDINKFLGGILRTYRECFADLINFYRKDGGDYYSELVNFAEHNK